MVAKTIMVQGTSSNAGKSMLVTAICGLLKRRGKSVCPFKPQNMSLNSAVTMDGGEIGRAQALQAQACGIEPLADMNPILLKPNTALGAQVVVQGRPVVNMDAAQYHCAKEKFLPYVLESYYRLASKVECVVVEGAGSPAEINLRDGDLANMGFAVQVKCPVLLVADIDRGGVFAQLVGTLALMSQAERDLVRGFVINKFRGDIELLRPGIIELEAITGKPVIGVLPYINDLRLDAEDSLSQLSSNQDSEVRKKATNSCQRIVVVIPRLPHISNQTDFDPLLVHPQVEFHLVADETAAVVPACDLIILSGSKNVYSDLNWLKAHGWEAVINRHLRYGGKLLGICGGFQMLGRKVFDPHGIESAILSFDGFGFLDMETTLEPAKNLKLRKGRLNEAEVSGYEIHMGVSSGNALKRPFVQLDEEGIDGTVANGGIADGAISDDGLIAGSYLHGIFDQGTACAAILKWAGLKQPQQVDYRSIRQDNIDKLIDAAAVYLDQRRLDEIIFDCRT